MFDNNDKKGKSSLSISGILSRIFFVDFLKGMSVTLFYNLSKEVTMEYPDKEKWIPYQRFRGRHTLNRDENGKELCVACELCVRACPTDCITVVPEEDFSGRGITERVAKVWRVDLVRCLYCGYCEDACPTTAVRLGREFETACYERPDTIMERDALLEPVSIPDGFAGGVVVKAKFDKSGERIKVVPDLKKIRKNFW